MNDPEWDDEVDVVCTDTGLAGLATAISAADQDGEVFLASAPTPARHGWFTFDSTFDDDEATADYIGSLTSDIDVSALSQHDADLPVRAAGEPVPVRRRPIPAFDGARLRDWAARCIPSPTGYLYTQVTDWTSATMDRGDGDLVKVTEIGEVIPDIADPIGSVRRWLTAQAEDRDLWPQPVTRFERLVFEDHVVTGAVFATADGPLAVRARHGVLICRHEDVTRGPASDGLTGQDRLRVALVGKEASRFGRVELLTD
ncbi:hypothetical protein [Mycolicibacterium parafortuitum]|uniref:FAD-dependent oxidoreductase 2 FAD binding domain-containing protein n=1 Tax=Mycolicibacterium parafortuitum TaxID=39692 RepID=A0A375YIU3_MYCPF|nr:hypothetical protein [Mycolicibacterium parafortuitum]SRX81046.1 hypothetical protein MPP7335_02793 [Mycolicibacterium parafortuitum]